MKSKNILITGGTSGIGYETALLLAKEGHHVYAASRRPPAVAMPGVTYIALDVCSTQSIQDCVQAVLAQAGQIDVLINNAGYVGPVGASEEVALDDVRALFETNFFGVVQMVNAVLPGMRQRRSGLIINISSLAGRIALPPFFGFYAASKHALEGYSKSLSADLHPLGIRVALVEPGYFATNIHNSMHIPAHPLADFAQAREHATAVDGFGIRHGRNPQLVARLINRIVSGNPLRLHYPVGIDVYYMLTLYALLPEKIFEIYTRWFLLGGQPVKIDDDDSTIRRKIGFRSFMLDSYRANWLAAVSLIVLAALVVLGLFWGANGK